MFPQGLGGELGNGTGSAQVSSEFLGATMVSDIPWLNPGAALPSEPGAGHPTRSH